MNKTLKLKHQINSSLPKINVMYSNEDFSNKMKDSLASSVGVRKPWTSKRILTRSLED